MDFFQWPEIGKHADFCGIFQKLDQRVQKYIEIIKLGAQGDLDKAVDIQVEWMGLQSSELNPLIAALKIPDEEMFKLRKEIAEILGSQIRKMHDADYDAFCNFILQHKTKPAVPSALASIDVMSAQQQVSGNLPSSTDTKLGACNGGSEKLTQNEKLRPVDRIQRQIPVSIYVGNLAWSITDDELRQLFVAYGSVKSAKVITDHISGRSRGFGFVEMYAEEAKVAIAIANINGKEVCGRPLKVNRARPRDGLSSNYVRKIRLNLEMFPHASRADCAAKAAAAAAQIASLNKFGTGFDSLIH